MAYIYHTTIKEKGKLHLDLDNFPFNEGDEITVKLCIESVSEENEYQKALKAL